MDISSFKKRIFPESGLWTPLMRFSSVDFPEPLGPTSPAISLLFTVKATFFSAWSPPKRFETSMHFSKWRCLPSGESFTIVYVKI